MLAKVSWWEKEGGVGTATDIDGKEWNISDDMIDDDEVKAKMKNGLVVNVDTNPALDNSGMRVDMATPDDADKFKAGKIQEATDLDRNAIKLKAPHDLQEFVEAILEYSAKNVEAALEVLEDDDALSEIADSSVDIYTNALVKWYAEDANRIQYADQAIEDGYVDPKGGMEKIMAAGQYIYNTTQVQEAKTWLEEYFKDNPSEAKKEESTEIGSLAA